MIRNFGIKNFPVKLQQYLKISVHLATRCEVVYKMSALRVHWDGKIRWQGRGLATYLHLPRL